MGAAAEALLHHSDRYTEEQLNPLRRFGLEKQYFYVGKRVHVISKAQVDEQDSTYAMVPETLLFDDGGWVTGNMPGTIVAFEKGAWVEAAVDHKPEGRNTVKVPVMDYSMEVKGVDVTIPLIGLKPEADRIVDLCQGAESDGPVHLVATKIYGPGKFYVGVTRAKKLANLKISGIEPTFAGVRKATRTSWRFQDWLLEQGEELSVHCKKYVEQQKKLYERAFGKLKRSVADHA